MSGSSQGGCKPACFCKWFWVTLSLECIHRFLSPANPTGLHVVRTGLCSYGRGQTLHLSSAETTYQSIPNFQRMITSVRWSKLPNFVAIDSTAAAPHVGEIYKSRFFFFFFTITCFVNAPADHNSQRILTYDGSKDLVWRKDVSIGYPKCYIQLLGVQSPQKLLQ